MPSSWSLSRSTSSTSCWPRCGGPRGATRIWRRLRRPRDNPAPPPPDARVLAVRLHAPGEKLTLEEVPLPEPSGREIRVRVAGCGVCHTDVHIARGAMTRVKLPLTLGHEVSGWLD